MLTLLLLGVVYAVDAAVTRSAPPRADQPLVPSFSHPGGYYKDGLRLALTSPDPTATIRFTLDGSLPTSDAGTLYKTPLLFDAATPMVAVVRVCVVRQNGEVGPVVTESYFIAIPATLPLLSLVVDPADLWDVETGIYTNDDARGDAWERLADVAYVNSDRASGFHVQAGVRVHGEWSRQFDKKSLRLYFRAEYGANRLEYPLFADSDVTSFKRLVLHAGGQDFQDALTRAGWTLFRNQLTANLAVAMGGYATHSQPALLFINGELWGIYQIRKRPDAWFLADEYGIQSADFCTEPNHPTTRNVIMGDMEHWENLLHFLETHSLADAENYAYVETQVDIANFIDYNLLQIYTANDDWPQNNVHQFRPKVQGGRWHWMFWDSDHGFGGNRDSDFNALTWALEQQYPLGTERDILLLKRLLENTQFRQRFFSRAAGLLNSTLSPSAVVSEIDTLAGELEPDIAYEATRWSSTTDWMHNIDVLRDFARERPDRMREHFIVYFGLGGTAQLILLPPVDGQGTVAVSDAPVSTPWEGVYFQTVPVHLTVVPDPEYRFAGWEPASLPQTPSITVALTTSMTVTPRFARREASEYRAGDVVITQITDKKLILRVLRYGGVDLRGWRITDNDAKTATDEGSLIFADDAAFARVPWGTEITIHFTEATDDACSPDDMRTGDRRIALYVCNTLIDSDRDPGFRRGTDDNVVLLAPGATDDFSDDQGIDFLGQNPAVTPATFGVLSDGVVGSMSSTP
jgi:hypothetical protein